MHQYVIDIEGDSLTPTRLWTLAAHNLTSNKLKSTTKYEQMKRLLEKADVIIGHNFMRFDAPCLERILNIEIKAKIVDTLALSWYLYPDRNSHGLEAWGEDLGVKKPPIIRWDDPGMIDEYVHRCEEDVKINTKLWHKMYKHLLILYGTDEEVWRFIDYLMFKMECAREQERSKWKLDIDLCTDSLIQLENDKEKAVQGLIEAMPTIPVIQKKSRPAKCYKADGSLSVKGALWFKLLRDNNLPEDYNGDVEIEVSYKEGNPNSSQQVKEWLYSKGWKPETFKFVKEEDGSIRKIPQINLEHGGGICPSIQRLYDHSPEFSLLEGLGVVSHRISILRGFLDNCDNLGFVQAQVSGLTNTLRFKHKTVVNLPKVNKPYGDIVRGALIAPDGYELCGSDMTSLEDKLKQHYIYPLDPAYVEGLNKHDYDAHLEIAVEAGMMTKDEMEFYKWYHLQN